MILFEECKVALEEFFYIVDISFLTIYLWLYGQQFDACIVTALQKSYVLDEYHKTI